VISFPQQSEGTGEAVLGDLSGDVVAGRDGCDGYGSGGDGGEDGGGVVSI